jgi:CBS domain-containing protein
MRRGGETALVVVNGTVQRTPLPVITDTDVAQAIADRRDPNEMRVNELVRRHPITISPETPLVRAAAVMVSSNIRHLPVVAKGRLLGMLDISDACRGLVELENRLDGSVTTVALV